MVQRRHEFDNFTKTQRDRLVSILNDEMVGEQPMFDEPYDADTFEGFPVHSIFFIESEWKSSDLATATKLAKYGEKGRKKKKKGRPLKKEKNGQKSALTRENLAKLEKKENGVGSGELAPSEAGSGAQTPPLGALTAEERPFVQVRGLFRGLYCGEFFFYIYL